MCLALQIDLFALGVSLYALVVGDCPFPSDNTDEIVNLHLSFPVYYPPTMSQPMRSFLEVMSHAFCIISILLSFSFLEYIELLSL